MLKSFATFVALLGCAFYSYGQPIQRASANLSQVAQGAVATEGAAAAGIYLTNGLVAYYSLDGDGLDSSGRGHDGAVTGAVPATNRFGVAGKALHFNGITDGVNCGNPADFNFQESFSVGLWLKFNGLQFEKYFIGKYHDGGNFNYAPHSFGLGAEDSYRAYGFATGNSSALSSTWGGPSLADDKWHALVYSYDHAFGIRIFEGGVLVASVFAPSLPPFTNDFPLTIGRVNSGQNFGGEIDDVRIYNRALSDLEVASLFLFESHPDSLVPVAIISQPQPVTVLAGSTVTFSVEASGDSISYQWFKGGNLLSDSTQPNLVLSNVIGADSGLYFVTVSNAVNHVDSQSAELIVTNAPVIPGGADAHPPYYVTTLGSGELGQRDGPLNQAQFDHPSSLSSDKSGQIYVVENHLTGFYSAGAGGHSIRVIDTNGMVSTWAGGAEAGFLNGPRLQAKFSGMQSLVFDKQGNGFVTDRLNNKVRKIAVDGMVSTFAGSTAGLADGIGSEAQFRSPIGMCIDTNDNLYVADWENARIRKISPAGEVSTFAGSEPGNRDGLRTEAQFYGPSYVAIAGDGTLYVADWANHAVRRIGTDGMVKTIASGLTYVESLSVDSQGFVYVAVPPGIHKLIKMDRDGLIIWQMGNGVGYQDGLAETAQFGHYSNPWFYPNGDFLVADSPRYVRKVTIAQANGLAVPVVLGQPHPTEGIVGGVASFSITAVGGELAYQWLLDGNPIAGAVSSNLSLIDLALTNAGNYSVAITNGVGSTISAVASLSVLQAPPVETNLFLTNGLVAYYSLNGNAFDTSGRGHHGLVNGAVPATNRFGDPGKALHFNGLTDGVDCGNPTDFTFQESFSLAVWVRLDGPQFDKYIMGKYNDAGNGNYSSHSFGLGCEESYRPYAFVTGDNSSLYSTRGGSTLADDKWHALVYTYDQIGGLRIHRDGVLVASLATPQLGPFTNDFPMMIGRVKSGQNFGGDIDDVRIYNRALTSDEARALYVQEATPASPDSIIILTQPQPATGLSGGTVSFSIWALGQSLGYQWFKDSVPVPGANQQTLTLSNLVASDAGQYSVAVSNFVAHADSQTAQLIVPLPVVVPVGIFESHSDLFEYPQNIQILATSSTYPNYSSTHIFSTSLGTDRSENFQFGGGKEPGFTHFVEWKTRKLVVLTNIILHAGGVQGTNVQEFNSFILKAKHSLTDEYRVIGAFEPPHPYGVSAANYFTLLQADVDAQSVQYFRAEFTQRDAANSPYGGPRVFELDGLGYVEIDHQAPVVTITSPVGGTTAQEQVVLTGTITDNFGVTSAQFQNVGVQSGFLPLDSAGRFTVPNLSLQPGTNIIRVTARDAATNQTTSEVVVVLAYPQLLSFANPGVAQEGGRVSLPLTLASEGTVGALTATIHYDTTVLSDVDFVWSDQLSSAFKQISISTTGEVRVVFALAGSPLPAGVSTLGNFEARARSVPAETTSVLGLSLAGVYDQSGSPIVLGNHAVDGNVLVQTRRIIGDNNANNRLDVGDATTILTLVARPEIAMPWDVAGNDLNANALLDPGDAIKVLRAVVGLDPQPTPSISLGSGRVRALGSGQTTIIVDDPSHLITNAPVLLVPFPTEVPSLYLTDGTVFLGGGTGNIVPGQKLVVRVNFVTQQGVPYSGASFRLSYPTNYLRLSGSVSHSVGSRVPQGSAVLWNVSPGVNDYAKQDGHISFAAASVDAWSGDMHQFVAEFSFDVSDTVSEAYAVPVTLDRSEMTQSNGLIFSSNVHTLPFHSQVAMPAEVATSGFSPDGKSFSMKINGQIGGQYRIDVSYDLQIWTPLKTVDSQNSEVTVEDNTAESGVTRFYRAVLIN